MKQRINLGVVVAQQRWIGILTLQVLGLLGAVNGPLRAEQPSPPAVDVPGICRLTYGLRGRWTVNPQGNLVSLPDYCRPPQTILAPLDLAEEEQRSPLEAVFWQKFLQISSPSALEFAETLQRDAIIAYGTAVCPILNNGGTLQDVRNLQARDRLPMPFEVAVSVAAIHTYCPQHVSQIGRR